MTKRKTGHMICNINQWVRGNVMMTFGIGTLTGTHAGFLLMAADDDTAASGSLMVKVQIADADASYLPEIRALGQFPQQYFVWRRAGEVVQVYDDHGEEVAQIQGEYLRFRGYTYRLNDLAGVW